MEADAGVDAASFIVTAALMAAVDELFDEIERNFQTQWQFLFQLAAIGHEGAQETFSMGSFALALGARDRLRRFWSIRADNFYGFWEKQVLGDWVAIGARFPDREDAEYLSNFRLNKGPFWALYESMGRAMDREGGFRESIPGAKRFAILLDWLSSGSFYRQLAAKYDVSKAAVVRAVHEGVDLLLSQLVPKEITLPETPEELQQVMEGFERMAFMPYCMGAMDGTFMAIKKPGEWGDSYVNYKRFPSILVLAVVDSNGRFMSVSTGHPGSVGDAFAYSVSDIRDRIENGYQDTVVGELGGVGVKPYLVADSAFSLTPRVMKAYDHARLTPEQFAFNYSIIRTRRIVENAFGQAKGRFPVVSSSKLTDPVFAGKVSLVAMALHNYAKRMNVPYDEAWNIPEDPVGNRAPHEGDGNDGDPGAVAVRNVLAKHVYELNPVRPAPIFDDV